MARIDHVIARRQRVAFNPRPVIRNGHALIHPVTKEPIVRYPWWPARFADLVERRHKAGAK